MRQVVHTPVPPPPRALPLLYFATAHAALITAFGAIALDPASFTGFFYHPRMLAAVHLITLGWITASILGAIYIVGPMALRMPMRSSALDVLAFASVLIGVSGMISHFWIEQLSGMAWSALMVVLGVGVVGVRVLAGLPSARIPRAVKAHIIFAFINIMGTGGFGVLLGFNKSHRVLTGEPLSYVYAHAHLAAIGWATMMIVGTGYRLLPMMLPAAMPAGKILWASAILLEIGAGGLFFCLAAGSGLLPVFGLVTIGGLAVFLGRVAWMRHHRRPAPVWTRRPDFGVLHVASGFIYLVLAAALGLVLSVASPSESTLHAASVYGVFGLIGFLAQVVLGVGARLIPMFSALHAVRQAEDSVDVPTPQQMPARSLQAGVFGLWTAAVPMLAAGAYLERTLLIGAGAWLMTAAALVAAVNTARVSRHVLRAGSPGSSGRP